MKKEKRILVVLQIVLVLAILFPIASAVCTETDAGKDYDTKGTCIGVYGTKEDTCTTDEFIREYYCEEPGNEWYDQICSESDLDEYIENYPGTDEELLSKLEDYCYGIGTYEGLRISSVYSLFTNEAAINGEPACWAECSTQHGEEDGHTYRIELFRAIWNDEGVRDYLTSVRIFREQEQCSCKISEISCDYGCNDGKCKSLSAPPPPDTPEILQILQGILGWIFGYF